MFKPQVVVRADAGQHRQLLAAQARNPTPSAAHQPDILGPHLLAPGPQEIADPIGLRRHYLSLIASRPLPGSAQPFGARNANPA
jgi:hypothetical protein